MSADERADRVTGALLGAAVGDALGAPFEFGPPGAFFRRFPAGIAGQQEMCGGGHFGWEPGEFTDDTQMSLVLAESLLARGGVDGADLFSGFRRWAETAPDVGAQTRAVLSSAAGWQHAAGEHFAATGRAAGNGSLMRTVPVALRFAGDGARATARAARAQSAVTHGDPSAGEGCVILCEMIRLALQGHDALAGVARALSTIPLPLREKWRTVLAPDWSPERATEPNGVVWPTLGIAVWALRQGWDYEEALRRVIDLGGDTDTVACVTGGLLGAVQGASEIPLRWTQLVHGSVPGHGVRVWRAPDFSDLALRLEAASEQPNGSSDLGGG